jgi:hypothetical protein
MADDKPSSTSSSEPVGGERLRPASKVLLRVLTTALQVAALMAAILFVVPDGNDYAEVTLDKHARLATAKGPKIVFVGGSNLAYGLDSPSVERALGREVANMGMNAYLGLNFVLEEVAGALKPGDTVVLSLENEMFRVQRDFDAADGRGTDVFMMVKTRPASWAYVPETAQRRVIAALPEVVQRKTQRVLGDLVRFGREPKLMDRIETRAAFNSYGDLVSHIGVHWPEPLGPGTDLAACPLDARIAPLLRAFRDRFEKQQVRVLLLPPPVPKGYFEAQRAAIEATKRAIDEGVPGLRIADPSRYIFPESCFFDDIHHLTGECRLERTKLVIEDLQSALGAAAAR